MFFDIFKVSTGFGQVIVYVIEMLVKFESVCVSNSFCFGKNWTLQIAF
jgi:hypothetical protein